MGGSETGIAGDFAKIVVPRRVSRQSGPV